MAKNLVIVESPAKAKTIEKYLGSDFKVMSSVGHIRSIAKKSKGHDGIDIKNGFKTTYEIDPDKKKIIADLKKAAKTAKEVWLATDEDREGEAIAWHLCEVLGLDAAKTRRIVFHEITKHAIEAAVKNPRTVDMDLVRAQQARQILDRIVGFDLSDVVRRKVPGGISAGRVQSPGVRLLVEREREIEKFESSFKFRVTAEFRSSKGVLKAELPQRFDTEQQAQKFLESIKDAKFTVSDVTTSPATRNPSAPFTTSTLQQDANSRLGFSAKATMAAAQKLYQDGKITYMRTDSVNLSEQAIGQMAAFIKSKYGEDYLKVRTFKTKSSGAQEAHEAIRPTEARLEKASSDGYNQKLYDLIRRRTLASQMAPAKMERTEILISVRSKESGVGSKENFFVAKGEVIIFDGFLKVYTVNKKEDDILPEVTSGDSLDLDSALAKQMFAKPPARYTEGSLVKKLEELGIGRPSTYATILGTIQARGYAVKGESEGTPRDIITLNLAKNEIKREVIQENTGSDRGKLVPTASGKVMSDFLEKYFDAVVDYDFTATVEKEFDQIAEARLERNEMLMHFYTPFQKLIEKSGDIERSEVAGAREVGKDLASGKPVIARLGRYGPMLQLGDTEDKDEKPRFAPLPKGAKLETITLEQAVEMFKLPRVVGQTAEGEEIVADIGRFGPYLKVASSKNQVSSGKAKALFVSLKEDDPFKITEEKARKLIVEKRKIEAERHIATFGDIQVLNGRYGPYITDGKKNVSVPDDKDPKKLTEAEAKKILEAAPAKKGRFSRRKK